MSFPTGINRIILEYILDNIHISVWCRTKFLEIFEWIYNVLNPRRTWCLEHHIFDRICTRGTVQVAQFVQQKILLTREEYNEEDFILACTNGKIDMVMWLHKQFPIDQITYNTYDLTRNIFQESCEYDHLDVAKWLMKNFNPCMAMDQIQNCIKRCYYRNNLITCKWLIEHYEISKDECILKNSEYDLVMNVLN